MPCSDPSVTDRGGGSFLRHFAMPKRRWNGTGTTSLLIQKVKRIICAGSSQTCSNVIRKPIADIAICGRPLAFAMEFSWPEWSRKLISTEPFSSRRKPLGPWKSSRRTCRQFHDALQRFSRGAHGGEISFAFKPSDLALRIASRRLLDGFNCGCSIHPC